MLIRKMNCRIAVVCTICALTAGLLLARQADDPANRIEERRRPVIKYTMASPRACLIGPPKWAANMYYLPGGDAENFARANGCLRVPLGSRVIFCLSRELEGIWYSDTYGALGASLVLQWCRYCKCSESDPDKCSCERCNCAECQRLGAAVENPDTPTLECPWVTIGRDGAKAVRKGPSIGRAKIGVPVHFRKPGIYYLRGIVHTFAEPYYTLPLTSWYERLLAPDSADKVLPPVPLIHDKDVVYVRVRVVALPIDQVQPDGEITEDPDVSFITPMSKDGLTEELLDTSADLNGDEVVNLGDLVLLSQQWGREYEMPYTDDE